MISTSSTGKYFKYAIGEIVLVVIGILVALQINNWNEINKADTKKNAFLTELKKNVEADIAQLMEKDSILSVFESSSEIALQKLYKAKNIQDLILVDSLFSFRWGDLRISRTVYDEMLNTGSLYSLKNDSLKKKIADYYTLIASRQYVIKKINDTSIELSENYGTRQLDLIRGSDGAFINKIDDSWIGDPNSKDYLALHKFYAFTQRNSNTYGRIFRAGIIKKGKELLNELNKELNLKE